MSIEKITVAELHVRLKAQGVSARRHLAFVCPMCRTVQSINDFTASGGVRTDEEAERYIGFSCIGRFTGGKSPRREPDGDPCDWSLGGLFSTHKLVVIDEEGREHPSFEVATPEQAQAHEAKAKAGAEA